MIGAAFATVWEAMRERRGAQLLSFELTTVALRNPELRVVATAQLERNLLAARELLDEAAAVAIVRWTVPVTLLARLSVATLDGIALAWPTTPPRELGGLRRTRTLRCPSSKVSS